MLIAHYLFASIPLYWWINVSTVFIISAVCAGIIIPQILLIAYRKRLFDPPSERKLHSHETPRLGGISFLPILVFSVLLLTGINLLSGNDELAESFRNQLTAVSFGFCATFLLFLTGVTDDLIGVRYRTKFSVQIFSALMLSFSGISIDNLHGLFGIYSMSPLAAHLLTVVVVVFIVNAINLIDGIDGLASGLGGIALFYYSMFFISCGEYIYALLSFALLGVIIPFFCYNVFGNSRRGRKIFMGDAGSLTLGILLSILSIQACTAAMPASSRFNPFATAFAPLIIPCFDVLRVFIHRLRTRSPLFAPDKNHIHHKLLDAGMSQHQALVSILAASLVFSAFNIACSPWINVNLLLAINITMWTLLNLRLTGFIKKKNKKKSIKTIIH